MDSEPCSLPATTAAGIPHDFAFDPSYGWTEERLEVASFDAAEPEGYDAFWLSTHQQAMADTAGSPEVGPDSREREGFVVRELRFTTLGGVKVGGWLCIPVAGTPVRVELRTHGYGGDIIVPVDLDTNAVTLQLCLPGFALSGGSSQAFSGECARHVLTGIEMPGTYSHRFCVAAVWSAVQVLSELEATRGLPVHYLGWSFGGGIGTLAVPWEPRIRTAELGQPTFGWHPFRLRHPCTGSGESVRRYWQNHPELRLQMERTLSFHEAVFASRRIRIPVLFVLSMFDPSVPPPGQFAVARACRSPWKKVLKQRCGHFDWDYPEKGPEARMLVQARVEMAGHTAAVGVQG